MTIKQKIDHELKTLQGRDEELYDICYRLYGAIKTIIHEASDHLSKIQTQMPDYDKHTKLHSEKVIENIECLLQEKGVDELTLLEAMLIELCGYFHDTGMALPDWGFKLLEEVEAKDYVFHNNGMPVRTIIAELAPRTNGLYGTFERIRDLFFCPESEHALHAFLAQEIWDYECYRMGLAEPSAETDCQEYLRLTRQEYLRSTHGGRAKVYAKHIGKKFTSLDEYDAEVIAASVGNICCGHCVDIKEVQALAPHIRICGSKTSEKQLTYNERYVAMLLRLGDVIHFSTDRTSRTLYAEHTPMNPVSDSHWQVKLDNLEYRIEQRAGKTTISYFAGFKKPQLYYFLQDYLNWVDDELKYYAAFVQDMEQLQHSDAVRYRIGLPTRVDRSGVKSLGFTPDDKLKFRLEQKKVIQLLMGLRLYSDEFMCLRELYQNALDACRCMQAKSIKDGLNGEFPIEFGIAGDDGGEYLYCHDSGTGMTKDVILNYLLQVGNSYYNSSDFRRQNAIWGDSVAPVSEFGIGLLSCYMIGTRIEVITRHYSDNSKLYWICMEGTEDYGYFQEVTPEIAEEIGNHGTIVKVYLKERYKGTISTSIPENIRNVVFCHNLYAGEIFCDDYGRPQIAKRSRLSDTGRDEMLRFHNCLYRKLQTYIHIPESGIPVYVADGQGRKHVMITANDYFDICGNMNALIGYGVSFDKLHYGYHLSFSASCFSENETDRYMNWLKQFQYYKCAVRDDETKAEAYTIIHLPVIPYVDMSLFSYMKSDYYIGSDNNNNAIYIDGIPVSYDIDYDSDLTDRITEKGMHFNFRGKIRPVLNVNRENIRSVSKDVEQSAKRMGQRLLTEIAKTIRSHFAEYPNAKTFETLYYLDNYLSNKYATGTYFDLMQQICDGLMDEYCVCGNIFSEAISRHCFQMPTSLPVKSWKSYSRIFEILLAQAIYISVDDERIKIKRNPEEDTLPYYEVYSPYEPICIRADEWKGKFSQYDVVRNLWPLIPERVFHLCGNDRPSFTVNSSFKKVHHGYSNSANLTDIGEKLLDSEGNNNRISRSDILMLLNSQPSDAVTCKCPITGIWDEENKKYVLFAFIDPHKLSKIEEKELELFENYPEYVRGVHEGWSILFYRYEDGYVISPGIVSREEMVKKIPDIARNHNDGITYCFTDGTVAF